MPILITAICLFILIVPGFLIGLNFTYKTAFHSDRSIKANPYKGFDTSSEDERVKCVVSSIKENVELPCERVYITSRDGLRLSARYVHARDGAPVDIMAHGYRSTSFTDFAGISKVAIKMGHNMLLIDQRAHAESEGKVISYGVKERLDVIDWTRYIIERFGEDTRIFYFGVSMGAATVLMAAAEENLPKNVVGVLADCPFSAGLDIIKLVAKGKGPASFIAGPLACIGARLGGFNLNETTAVRAAANIKIPTLLVHGDKDGFVPYCMSEKIAAANPDIIFETYDSCEHALSYFSDEERYTKMLTDFCDGVLKQS